MQMPQQVQDFLEERRQEVLVSLGAIVCISLIFCGIYWWTFVRWQSPPSIFDAPVDDVLGYLALDDFNQLPMDERMRYLLDFADRFRDMGQSESAAMSAFLAGLSGPTREQLTENAKVLAKDILAQGADQYVNLPEQERADFLNAWMLEWMKTGERLATGEERQISDEERMERMQRGTRRGQEREREATDIPELTTGGALTFMDFWQEEVETTATPREQSQIARFLVDLRKHMSQDPGDG